ncbi:MAG: HlyD family secretion protein [Phycisphaerales bacterium]|nr:HlyD family secretion protein [Phycisphaerales bacterium]MCI0632216.1 HlyD family secretion protein [Phycisphaerales bacterium]MCI0676165.1 HlyD family secretion protein [Phycisphaerales bacterium]
MANGVRIATSWSRRMRQVRQGFVPLIVFLAAAAATGWLWRFNTGLFQAIGEVQAVRYEITSPADGVLASLPRRVLMPFDEIEAGELLVQLAPDLVLAQLSTARAKIAQTAEELSAKRAEIEQMQAEHELELRAEARRLAIAVEDVRLEVLDRRAELEAQRLELALRSAEFQSKNDAFDSGAIPAMEVLALKLRRDEVAAQVAGNEEALKEAEAQLAATGERQQALAAASPPAVEAMLLPIRASIAVLEAELGELEVQREALAIYAPADGMIAEVHRWPGQAVQAGDPIVTVAQPESRYVIAYVREHQNLNPDVGDRVELRTRSVPRRSWRAAIERIGAQIEPIPPHHLRDAQRPEWGLPLLIALSDDSTVRPGELVDISFKRSNAR